MNTAALLGMVSVFLLLSGSPGFAATTYVPDDYGTIQEAIAAALDGDIIIVRPGVYPENITFLGKAVTVQSESGPGVTMIHGRDWWSVVTFKNGEGVGSVLKGFTITNGIGTENIYYGKRYGGGIYCHSSSPTITENNISGNSADWGGGIYCESSSPLISKNLIQSNTTIRNDGGGICCLSSNPQIMDNIIQLNTTDRGEGAGIFCNQSSPQIIRNIIKENAASGDGAGIHCASDSHAVITDNTIQLNIADRDGAGIYCDESDPQIVGNLIEENSADGDGGGIQCDHSSPTISGNVIRLNDAGQYGAGINCYYSSTLIVNNIIEENHSSYGGGICCNANEIVSIERNVISKNSGGWGGGIWCDDDLLDIKDNEIRENTASQEGGGISCCDARLISGNTISGNLVKGNWILDGGGGIFCDSSTSVAINDNVITSNTAPSGGGIACTEYSCPLLNRNIISSNLAADFGFGGGILIDQSSAPILTDLIVTGNAAGDGGGIYCTDNSQPVITNCTVSGNTAEFYGGGICIASFSVATVTNTVLWSDTAVSAGPEIALFWHAGLDIEYSDIEAGNAAVYISPTSTYTAGSGMIDADPLFAGPSSMDFHLTYDSPCRNAGDGSATGIPDVDFENDPRVHDGAPDMGADEFHPHLYFTGDAFPGAVVDVRIVGSPLMSPVTLGLGSGILDPPDPTPYGDLYLAQPIHKFDIGSIPESGVLIAAVRVPVSWAPGEEHPLQSLIGPSGLPDSILTNLLVVTVLESGADRSSEGGAR